MTADSVTGSQQEIASTTNGRPAQQMPGSTPFPASLWRSRRFLVFWLGQTTSELGSQVTVFVLPLFAVTVINASTFQVSFIEFLNTLAFLLISLPAGVLVDRLRKRRLMLGCDIGRMILIGSIPVAGLLWHVTLWQLYAVATVTGVLTVLFEVAYPSYLPSLVGRDVLADANGKLGTTESFSRLAGPSLGGGLVSLVGSVFTIGVDAVSYGVSALSLAVNRIPEAGQATASAGRKASFRAEMKEGLSYVWRHRTLRSIVSTTATANLFSAGTIALRVIFLVRILHAAPGIVGVVYTVSSAGAFLGGLGSGLAIKRIGSARVIWVSALAPAPFLLLLPLARPGAGVWLYAAGWAVSSAADVLYNIAQVSYRQMICPPEFLGRMNASVRWITWSAMPIGTLMGGGLAVALGIRTALWICVIGTGAAAVFVMLSPLRRLRDFPPNDND